jgi:hypothetical protein
MLSFSLVLTSVVMIRLTTGVVKGFYGIGGGKFARGPGGRI